MAHAADLFQVPSLSAVGDRICGLALCRFTLSFSDVEEMLDERGVDVSNEIVRRWILKVGGLIASNLRRSRPQSSPPWYLDEMVIKIRGRKHWLWRAVDDAGEVLHFLV